MHTPTKLVGVRPDGTVEDVGLEYEDIRSFIDNWIEFVEATATSAFYVDEEGMLNRQPLNVPASLYAGRPLYGPVVLCSIKGPDTAPPDYVSAMLLRTFADLWMRTVAHMERLGQDWHLRADPDAMPGPVLVEIEDGESIEDAMRRAGLV